MSAYPALSGRIRTILQELHNDEYRGFRHIVRNVYAFTLHPPRIKELSDGLPACWKAICEDPQMPPPYLTAFPPSW